MAVIKVKDQEWLNYEGNSISRRIRHKTLSHYQGCFKTVITYVGDRAGHDVRYAIDATKIDKELHWTPDETFATGIKKTVEWYLENTIWCDRVKDGSYQGERLGVVK